MKKLNEITIADLMPDSISRDAEVSATAQAIDPQLKAISEAVDRPLILASIDELGSGVLEHLAVQYDVTAWNSAWPIETKRAVLKIAIADKRKIGTRGAVQRAIEAVAPIATITEWWQDTSGDMPPHTFEIDLLQEGSAVDAETQASVIAQVNEAKPVRSHFTFSVGQMLGGNVYFAGVLRSIAYARVGSAGITIEQTSIQAGVLATVRGMAIRRFLAETEMGEMPEPEALIRGGLIAEDYDYEIRDALDALALMVPGSYAYQDGDLLDMDWDFGGVVEEYVPISQPAIGGIMTATTDSKFYGDVFGVLELDVVSLPTVSTSNSFEGTSSNRLYASRLYNTNLGIGATFTPFTEKDFTTNALYDSGKSYAIVSGNGSRDGTVKLAINSIQIVESNACVAWKNVSGTSVHVYSTKVATCDSVDATVITVYNSSNEAFNAFKYTLNGADYYYVLDGVQTDWTDDLESIGFHIIYVAYMLSSKEPATINSGGAYGVYDELGNYIPYDQGKSYTITKMYSSSTGSSLVPPSGLLLEKSSITGNMRIHNTTNTNYTIQRVEYSII